MSQDVSEAKANSDRCASAKSVICLLLTQLTGRGRQIRRP